MIVLLLVIIVGVIIFCNISLEIAGAAIVAAIALIIYFMNRRSAK